MRNMAENQLEIGKLVAENDLYHELLGGRFGIEIEEHRVTEEGRLSRRVYPDTLGPRATHPYLQTDYSETQSEIVTEPATSFEMARDLLLQLQWVLRDHMAENETIWPLSMPPRLTPDDLQWVDETFDRPWISEYRDWLTDKYGSTHEIITGLHLNYSLPESLLEKLFALSDETDYVTYKNRVYFKLAQAISANRWLFVYLFGATPFSLNSTDSRLPELEHPVRSLRTSQFGFANDANIQINYATNLADHLDQIDQHIQAGDLYSNHEFYGTVRFKGPETKEAMVTEGVHYLELRILDADPFDPAGISENALNIIHLVIIYLLLQDEVYSADDLVHADELANEIAMQSPTDKLPNQKEALALMGEVSKLADHFGMRFNDGLSLIAERILTPSKTPAAKIVALAKTPDELQAWATKVGNERGDLFHVKHDEQFEDLFGRGELASVIKQAYELGVRVKERTRDTVTLSVGDHVEVLHESKDLTELFPEILPA